MSFIVAAVVVSAVSTGYGAYKGGQKAEAAEEARNAAKMIEAEQKALLARQKELKDSQNLLAYTAGAGDITTQSSKAIESTIAQGRQAELKTGFETGPTQKMATGTTSDIINQAQTSLQKLVDTRKLASASSELDFRSGEIGIEKGTASMMASIDPGGWEEGAMEGFVGSLGTVATIAGGGGGGGGKG